MKVAVVYVCPTENNGDKHAVYASRFAESYIKHPASYPHELVVVSNGGPPSIATRALFPTAMFMVHDGSGKDIGAYQFASSCMADRDIIVFCGGSTYIRGSNWLGRIVHSYQKHGEALYGVMANCGNLICDVWPHIRTTGFWTSPALFNKYPERVKTDVQRYPFEHSRNCLTQWLRDHGFNAFVVTWEKEYPPEQWHAIPDGFHSGSQSGLILGDRLTEPPYHPTP